MYFVIPSLSRAETLCQKSLALLLGYGVPEEDIHLFVLLDQIPQYQEAIQRAYPGARVQLHPGPLGLHHMRNHIQGFFPIGAELVCLDDDIQELQIMVEREEIEDRNSSRRYSLQPLGKEAFWAFLQEAFQDLQREGAHLFGIYPVRNGFFMKDLPEKTWDLRFIVGCFWGYRNRHDRWISIEEKEDFERTLLCYERDGKVLRYNRIAPKTSYYKEKGGMQDRGQDRKEAAKESCRILLERFPGYCRLYTSKKSGVYEVRLRDRTGDI